MPKLTRDCKNKTVYRLLGEAQTQGLILQSSRLPQRSEVCRRRQDHAQLRLV